MKINFKKNMVFILLSFFILETTLPAETKEIMLDEQTKEISTKQKTISEKSIYIKEVVENFLVTHKKKLSIAALAILCGLGFNHYVLKPFKKDIYDPIKENLARGDKLAKEAELLMQDVKTVRNNSENLELIKNVIEATKQLNAIAKNLKHTPAELRAEGKTMEADVVEIIQNLPQFVGQANQRLGKIVDPTTRTMTTLMDDVETLAGTINETKLMEKIDNLVKKIDECNTIPDAVEIVPKVKPVQEHLKQNNGTFGALGALRKFGNEDRSRNPKPSASNTTTTEVTAEDNPETKNDISNKGGMLVKFKGKINKLLKLGKASPENLAILTDIHELKEACAALEDDLEDGSEDEDGDSSTSGDKYNDQNPKPNAEYTGTTTTTEVTGEGDLKTQTDNGSIPSSSDEGSDSDPDENDDLDISVINPTSPKVNDSLYPIPLNDWAPDQLPQESNLTAGNDTSNSIVQPVPTNSTIDASKNSDSKQNQSFMARLGNSNVVQKTKSGAAKVGTGISKSITTGLNLLSPKNPRPNNAHA